jgi:Phage integrase family
LVFSGVRVSELLGLTWGEVDFDNGVIELRFQMSRNGNRVPLKTHAGRRDVILMKELAQLLKLQKLATPFSRDDHLVITNGIGRTLGYSRLRKAFAAAAREARIDGATPHTVATPSPASSLAAARASSSSPTSSGTRARRQLGISMSTCSGRKTKPKPLSASWTLRMDTCSAALRSPVATSDVGSRPIGAPLRPIGLLVLGPRTSRRDRPYAPDGGLPIDAQAAKRRGSKRGTSTCRKRWQVRVRLRAERFAIPADHNRRTTADDPLADSLAGLGVVDGFRRQCGFTAVI